MGLGKGDDVVILPKEPDHDLRKHDWDDKELQKWMENAKRLQIAHYNDNQETLTFKFGRHDDDAILLRLCVLNYGMRAGYSNSLQAYSKDEKKPMKDIIKTIKKECGKSIEFNIVYVSVGIVQASNGCFGSREIPLLQLTSSKQILDLTDPGCLYSDYQKFLSHNKLEPSVILYPSEGTYAKEKIELKLLEPPSCTFTHDAYEFISKVVTVVSVVSTFMTPACVFAGPALAAWTARVAVSGSFWAASLARTAAALATASKYLELANTITTIMGVGFASVGIYQKLQRGETFYAEISQLLTVAMNQICSRIQKGLQFKYGKGAILDGKTFAENVARFTKYDQMLFFTARLLPMLSSSSSLALTFYNLLSNPNRTTYDLASFSISLFMFTNTLIQPWNLKAIVENRALYDTIMDEMKDELRGRFKTDESRTRYEEDVTSAQGDDQKTVFLVRNLYRIADLEGFYHRMHSTQSTVQFNRYGFVLNQNFDEMSPEFYNQIGRTDFILGEIDEEFLLHGKKDRVIKLIKEYDPTANTEKISDYLDAKLAGQPVSADLQAAVNRELSHIESLRKDHLFNVSSQYNKDQHHFVEMAREAERTLGNGKTLEELKATGQATPEQIEQAERIRKQQSAFLRFTRDPKAKPLDADAKEFMKQVTKQNPNYVESMTNLENTYDDNHLNTIADQTERSMNGGKTLSEWREQLQNTPSSDTGRIAYIERNIERAEAIQPKREAFMNFIQDTQQARDFKPQVNQLYNQNHSNMDNPNYDYVRNTMNFYKAASTFNSHEGLTNVIQSDVVKHSIQHAFGVTNYRDALVNGQPIFRELSNNELNGLSGYFNSPNRAKDMVEASLKLLNHNGCTWTGTNASEVGDGMKLLGEYVKRTAAANSTSSDPSLPKTEADVLRQITAQTNPGEPNVELEKAVNFFNKARSEVEQCWDRNPSCTRYRNPYTAYGHFAKHPPGGVDVLDPNGSVQALKGYLVDLNSTIFKSGVKTQEFFSQDGLSMQRNFVQHLQGFPRPRSNFGVTSTPVGSRKPTMISAFVVNN